MKAIINKQLELIDQSIKWINNSLEGEKKEKKYQKFMVIDMIIVKQTILISELK